MPFTIKKIKPKKIFWRSKQIKNLIAPFFTIAIFLLLGGVLSFAMLAAWVSRDLPDPNKLLDRNVALSTKIYDRTGEHLLYEIHGNEARTLVKQGDLPDYMIKATVAIEDKNFYKHRGVAIRSIARAAIFNVLGDTISRLVLRRPSGAGGASTITQQLVKNAILSPEQTFSRKIKEIILSIEIERRLSKDQILQLYFNEIPYGRSNYGIAAASMSYFGKAATELSLAEAATLASLVQRPTAYLNDPERLRNRRDYVLDLMVEQGYVSAEEANNAKKEAVVIRQRKENITAPHFVFWIKQNLTEKYGERLVEQGGLKVITTLDFEKQKAAEEAVATGIPKIEERGGENAALVALDPHTGHILAMVGSRDYFDTEHDGAVNVALRPRQPGSSFKPIVYAAGFIKGFTSTTILYDVITTFKTETNDYEPKNYNLKEYGPITVRQALAGSLNIPAVKMLYLTGVERVLDFAEELGYTTFNDRSRFGLSLVLGGGEVKLLEHAAVFGTFATEGLRFDPANILRLEDSQGRVLEEWKPKEGRRVFDQEIARQITDILQDNGARAYIFGSANSLILSDRPVAVKTGTTNNYHDAWTIGYVPSLVAGVWVGNNDNTEMSRGADGSVVAAPIWQWFMKNALANTPAESFTPPQAVVTGKSVLDGQIGGGVVVKIDRASNLLATEFTPPNWIEERSFSEPHSILHFINKDDPRGEPPADPASDPQYPGWEMAVRRWAETNAGIVAYVAPPTEYDRFHNPENHPRLAVNQPMPGTTINTNQLIISIQTSAPRGIRKVQYMVDGVLTEERVSFPFDGTIMLPQELPKGNHTLTVVAFDDIDNQNSVSIPFITE